MAEFTIMLAPTLELAQTIVQNAAATVEAEYGDICVEGKDVTLAHHGPRSGNPAPCNTEVGALCVLAPRWLQEHRHWSSWKSGHACECGTWSPWLFCLCLRPHSSSGTRRHIDGPARRVIQLRLGACMRVLLPLPRAPPRWQWSRCPRHRGRE